MTDKDKKVKRTPMNRDILEAMTTGELYSFFRGLQDKVDTLEAEVDRLKVRIKELEGK